MAVKDVETPLAGEPKEDESPTAEIVETPEGLEAEIPDEDAPSWREKKRKRLEEYKSLEEERNRLREENERLRAQPPQYQQPYQPPTPQPRPEETEYGQVDNRLNQIKKEKTWLWKVGQNTTDKAELEELAKRADELESERELLAGRKAQLVYGTHQPVTHETPQQAQLKILQGEFQDVYADERARVKAEAVFKAAIADGKRQSPELLRESLLKARSWQRAGYKDARVVSEAQKSRTTGERSGGPGTGSENRVKVTPDVTKWAKALYPKLPEREAIQKYLGAQGKAVQGIQSKKAG